MISQPKELHKNDKLVNILSRMISIFRDSYKALHGDTGINGMPRRVQLSSLVLRLLFQNAELAKEISAAFFSDMSIRNFFGITAGVDMNSGEVFNRRRF